ncbi:MAG: M15 family metallopeptidase [Thermodesulfobacteriota bacterium]
MKDLAFFTLALILSLAGPALASDTLYGHRAYEVAEKGGLAPAGNYRDTGRVVKLTTEAAGAFKAMREAAQRDGVGLVPISGFRTFSYQKGLFERAVRKYGSEEKAARWVAPPGHSEHHTGTAIDMGDKKRRGCDVESCFEETPAFRWLSENASRFGFYLSFPKEGTAVSYEPWHWRLKGVQE